MCNCLFLIHGLCRKQFSFLNNFLIDFWMRNNWWKLGALQQFFVVVDSNHALEFKFPLITNQQAHQSTVSRNTSFQLGNLFTVSTKQFRFDWRIETFGETIRCAYEIDISLSRSFWTTPKNVKGMSTARRGKVNKRPLKFIITGFIILKLLGARWMW